jgi:dihydrofolate synthase/folylpolyglutamate synthase
MQSLLKEFPRETHPTFFEVVTVMALQYFAEQGCGLVILETGLGGRLDATNIVSPLASVITNVQFDHQQWLGNSLAQIAAEKAGIIKPGVPVISGVDAPEALEVVKSTAQARQAPLTVVGREQVQAARQYELGLIGAHQRANAAVALATVQALQKSLPASPAAIQAGLKNVRWAGRLQCVRRPGGQTVLLDGAHNPAGALTLARAIEEYFPKQRPVLILGAMRDKDWPGICHILAPLASTVFLCPTGSERSADPQMLVNSCREANSSAPIFVCQTLKEALDHAAQEPLTVVSGSLYLIGEAMELLELSPASGERGLNEWTAKPA